MERAALIERASRSIPFLIGRPPDSFKGSFPKAEEPLMGRLMMKSTFASLTALLLFAAATLAHAEDELRRESREPAPPVVESIQPTFSSNPPELTPEQFDAQLDIETLKG